MQAKLSSGIRYFQTVSRTFTMNASLNGSDPTDTIAIRDPNKTIALPATCWSGSSSYDANGGFFIISCVPSSKSLLQWDVGALQGHAGWSGNYIAVDVNLLEIPNAKKIQYITGADTDGTTKTILAVNTAKTIIVPTMLWGEAHLYNRGIRPVLTNSTTVTLNRESNSVNYHIDPALYNAMRWAVIELT